MAFHAFSIVIAIALAFATADAAWQDEGPVQITLARLRTVQDHYGQKLKLSYNWVKGASKEYQVCIKCQFDDAGERINEDTAGFVKSGGTCGGPSNGCLSVKGKDLTFGDYITVAIRYAKDDASSGVFSAWSPVQTYYIDPEQPKGHMIPIQSEEQKKAAAADKEL